MQKFKISPKFLKEYETKEVNWGFNGLGYFVFKRTYSRPIYDEDGNIIRTEEWRETVQRVVEGSFTYQKKHCNELGIPWNNQKAQRSAQKMYDKILMSSHNHM